MPAPLGTVFPQSALPIRAAHETNFRPWPRRDGASLSDNRGGPWGPGGGGDDGGCGGGGGPRNPWGPRRRKPAGGGGGGDGGGARPVRRIPERSRERFGGGFPRGRPALLALRPDRLPPALDPVHQRPADRPAGARRRHHASAAIRGRWPGIGFSLPCADRQRDQARRRRASAPSTIPGSGENLILTGDQNVDRPRLFGALEHQRSRSSTPSRSPIPRRPSARSPKARCARRSRGVTLDDAIGAGRADIEQRVAAEHAAGARRLSAPASRSRASRSTSRTRPSAVNEAFLRSLGGAAARAERDQQCPRLRAADHRRAPRARRPRSTRSMPNIALAPEVTRRRMYYETMERVLPAGRHDDRRGAGRDALSAAARDPAPRAQPQAPPQGAPAR